MFDKNLRVLLQNWYSNKMKLGHLRSENKVWKFVGWNENGGGAVGGWEARRKEVAEEEEEEEEERAGRISVTAWLESWLRVATKNTHF